MNNLMFKKLSNNAILPTRASCLSAGLDLSAAHDLLIPALGKGIVKTDLAVALPKDVYGRVAPRSGLAIKHHLDVGAGVVDADYRGNIGIVLFNHANVDFQVRKGDRIAQFICERIWIPEVLEVTELDDTRRGAAGYGSSGVN